MNLRVTVAVSAAWLIAGVVWGAQSALGSSLTGNPMPLRAALPPALVQSLPWIPVTLAIIALSARFTLTRESWRRRLPIHIAAAPILAFFCNVLVVLGFWLVSGTFRGVELLLRQAALWTTVRLHIGLLIYAAIATLTHGLLYYRASRERELHLARLEGQLARARLQALNAQIRPHFLFNTLHTIGQLWRSGRSDDADAMLDRLGSLFHRVQSVTAQAEVPLDQELELVRDYLAIEHARFADRLRPEVNATPEALQCLVPPLILQPLVENAVRHGISASSSAGAVEVDVSVEAGRLHMTVRDDGPGVGEAAGSSGNGTGLRNTEERLKQLYGEEAVLRIASDAQSGTMVRIEMPARKVDETVVESLHD